MKKIYFILMFLFCTVICSSAEYVLVNSDEHNANGKKYYGTQLESSVNWKGMEVVTDTTTFQSVYHYNQGISTTTYLAWWNVHASSSTVYRDGFTYPKYYYPN